MNEKEQYLKKTSDILNTNLIMLILSKLPCSMGRSHKTFLGVNLLTLFVSYTLLELWKHIVGNNEKVYLTKNPE